MTLKEMRQRFAAQRSRCKVALAEFNTLSAKETPTAEETAKLGTLDAELTAIETECTELESKIAADERKARLLALASGTTAHYTPARTMNEPNPATTGGFSSLAEFSTAVRNAAVGNGDARLFAAAPGNTQLNQGTAGEGFLVPPDFSRAIWDVVFPGAGYGYDLMDYITSSPTEKNMVQLVKDETTPWSALGVQAVWRSEAAQLSASRISLNGAMVPLHELYAFVAATGELLEDSAQLNDRLTMKAGQAIRYQISKAIFQGTGNGQPLGFMNGPGTIVQAKESGQTNGTVVLNNVAKMFTRLPAMSLPKAIFLANIEVLPQLINLNIGTWPVWLPPNSGLAQAPGGTLLGRPLVFTEQALALGSPGDIMLLDPTGYFLTNKAGGGIEFATSIHLYFDQNVTAFRWLFRVGGQPFLTAPIQPANGTLTKGHFVTLAQR